MYPKRSSAVAYLAMVIVVASVATAHPAPDASPSMDGNKWQHPPPPITVQNNRIVNAHNGKEMVLRGVTRTGTDTLCAMNKGIFDGPVSPKTVQAMKRWGANMLRLPLNEECWLGTSGRLDAGVSGKAYQNAIHDYANKAVGVGMYVVLALSYAAPNGQPATKQYPMPNADNSRKFWVSVAKRFKNHSAVLFDLYSEPFPGNGTAFQVSAWQCWGYGGVYCNGVEGGSPSGAYSAVGMTDLVHAVRTGAAANNILLASGIAWGNSMVNWLGYAPADPLRQTAAAWHARPKDTCNAPRCWNSNLSPLLIESVPVVVTNIQESDCDTKFAWRVLDWMRKKKLHSYAAWQWSVGADKSQNSTVDGNHHGGGCKPGAETATNLISDYIAGTCTVPYGCAWQKLMGQY